MRSAGQQGSDLEQGHADRPDVTKHPFSRLGRPVLAARQDVLNERIFRLGGCIGVAGIPAATALAGSGQGASSMMRS